MVEEFEAVFDRCKQLLEEGDLASALEYAQKARSQQPDDAEITRILGGLLDAAGRTEEGVSILEENLRSHPDHGPSLNDLGAILSDTGEKVRAMDLLKRAVRANPEDPAANFNLASLLLQEGFPHEAVYHFEAAARLEPESAENHLGTAVSLHELGRLKDARIAYERACELAPEDPGLLLDYARCLEGLGEEEDALVYYERSLEIDDSRTDGLLAYATLLLHNGHSERARSLFEEVRERAPEASVPYIKLGLLYHSQGEPELASEAFATSLRNLKRELDSSPDDETLAYEGVIATLGAGESDAASLHLDQVLGGAYDASSAARLARDLKLIEDLPGVRDALVEILAGPRE